MNMKKLLSLIITLCCVQAISAQPLQRVAPEQVGMDSRRLMYTDELIEAAIANEEIPGAVLAVVKDGKMAYLKAYGNKRIYGFQGEHLVAVEAVELLRAAAEKCSG